jgi:hypothetical protein
MRRREESADRDGGRAGKDYAVAGRASGAAERFGPGQPSASQGA